MRLMRGIIRRGKSDTFYAVVNIPADVRHAFGGARQKWVSLGTTEETDAIRRGAPIIADLKDKIRSARGQTTPSAASAKPTAASKHVRAIHPDRAWAAIRQWRHDAIEEAYVAEFNGTAPKIAIFTPEHAALSQLRTRLQNADWVAIPGFDAALVKALTDARLEAALGHPALPNLRRWFGEAWSEVEHFSDQFRAGRFSIWPEEEEPSGAHVAQAGTALPPQAHVAPGMKLMELFDRWEAVERPDEPARLKTYVRRLSEFLGDPDIRAITTAQLDDFLVRLRTFPLTKRNVADLSFSEVIERFQAEDPAYRRLAPKTVWNWFRIFNQLFRFAVQRQFLDRNPVSMPRLKDGDEGERLAYDDADIALIFSRPLFLGASRMLDKQGRRFGPCLTPGPHLVRDAYYWLPIFCLWHGCRVEEIGAAKAADIRSEGGVWFLDLRSRKLKNRQSQRQVPIHPKVVELGFVQYALAQEADGYLFPDLPHDPADEDASTRLFSKWWGRWCTANAERKGQGFDQPDKVFHSFRHAFKRACRGRMDEEIHDLLTGHKGSGSVGRGYGRGMALTKLAKALAKVDHPTFPQASLLAATL